MHISEGILPSKILISGYVITGVTLWYSLRQLNRQSNPSEGIPQAALLTAAFFIASGIQIPIPPASVHFVLNGLLGAVLGWYGFPAIIVGLLFQAIMFGHGGLTTLGINAVIMGIPALIAGFLFHIRHQIKFPLRKSLSLQLFGFLAGIAGVGLSALLFFSIVITNLPSTLDQQLEKTAIYGLMFAHIPLILIEGFFTAMVVSFLQRVKPEILIN
ncbi:cobalt transporter CbiM [Planktothrix sp.]|uniref:cobalt transporter CbiM n=1 Tax=Planktothrix sp. TaxID=3088171 RepID=UPI0038D43B71